MKVCSKCWGSEPIEEFNKDRTRPDGYSYLCKECHRDRGKVYSSSHPEEREAYRIETTYGINSAELFEMLDTQNNQCATCGFSITLERKHVNRAHIDHDHISGKVRELLCRACNLAIGNVKENKTTLMNMIKYLEKHDEHENRILKDQTDE